MSRFLLSFVVLLTLCAGHAGCSSTQPIQDFWRGAKYYYYEYLNTPTKLTLDDSAIFTDYETYLGAAMYDVNHQLSLLLRVMGDSDSGPDMQWVNKTLRRFPWLSGLAIVRADGTVTAKAPEYSLKEFAPGPLLEDVPGQRRSDLRAYVHDTPLGAEIYLGKPVYVDDALRVVIVAHFDMRALVAYSKNPGVMIIATPDLTLWPGVYDLERTPFPNHDWKALTSSNVTGIIKNENGEFYWNSTYFANQVLIWAVPASGDFPVKPEQLEELRQADSYAVPGSLLLPYEPQRSRVESERILPGEAGSEASQPAPGGEDLERMEPDPGDSGAF